MIYSMTGYGSSTSMLNDKNISVEIRALNSKGFDLNLRIPASVKPYELELRNLLSSKIIRGKVDCTIKTELFPDTATAHINKALLSTYLKELSEIAEEQAIAAPDLLSIAIRLPNVVDTEEDAALAETEWNFLKKHVEKSIAQLYEFRNDEGHKLKEDLLNRISYILDFLQQIETIEKQRPQKIKNKLIEQLQALQSDSAFDKNRLEQEMIYYLEKLDITEEVVRLRSHCQYFKETLGNKETEKGKKLAFIAQEIGREINTIGSKANDAEMQKLVVQMKDDLEKIKEQLNNVL